MKNFNLKRLAVIMAFATLITLLPALPVSAAPNPGLAAPEAPRSSFAISGADWTAAGLSGLPGVAGGTTNLMNTTTHPNTVYANAKLETAFNPYNSHPLWGYISPTYTVTANTSLNITVNWTWTRDPLANQEYTRPYVFLKFNNGPINLSDFDRVEVQATGGGNTACYLVSEGCEGVTDGYLGKVGGTYSLPLHNSANVIPGNDNGANHSYIDPERITGVILVFQSTSTFNITRIEAMGYSAGSYAGKKSANKDQRLIPPKVEPLGTQPDANKRVIQKLPAELSPGSGSVPGGSGKNWAFTSQPFSASLTQPAAGNPRYSDIYHVLHLPADWDATAAANHTKKWPIIVEYAGNAYWPGGFYSGAIEDNMLGYGVSGGYNYIWISLPCINMSAHSTTAGRVDMGPANTYINTATSMFNNWGLTARVSGSPGYAADPNALTVTADYARDVIRYVCQEYGGDPSGVFITGFSRGAMACGVVGLYNDTIADAWIGFNPDQHTDGAGWATENGNGNTRLPRLRGRAVAIVDNRSFANLGTWRTQLGIGSNVDANDYSQLPNMYRITGVNFHTQAAYMDERSAMGPLPTAAWAPGYTGAPMAAGMSIRDWYDYVYHNKPGTHKVYGKITNNGVPVANMLIEAGPGTTHFTYTDADGNYELAGLTATTTRTITYPGFSTTESATAGITLPSDAKRSLDLNIAASPSKEVRHIKTNVVGGYGALSCTGATVGGSSAYYYYVRLNNNATVNITPDTGFELDTLTVNGVDVFSSVASNQYLLSSVTEDKEIVATFKLSGPQYTEIALDYTFSFSPVFAFYGTLQQGTSSGPISTFGFEVKDNEGNELSQNLNLSTDINGAGEFGVKLQLSHDALNQSSFWVRLFFTDSSGTGYDDNGNWTEIQINL